MVSHRIQFHLISCFRGASAASRAGQNAGRAGQNASWAGQNAGWAQKGSHQDSKFGAGARVQRVDVKNQESRSERHWIN